MFIWEQKTKEYCIWLQRLLTAQEQQPRGEWKLVPFDKHVPTRSRGHLFTLCTKVPYERTAALIRNNVWKKLKNF